MKFYTADLCDKYGDKVQVLDPILKSYGGVKKVMGQIVTLKIEDNNISLAQVVKTDGKGKILVIDVNAKYTAVVGDNMMKLAHENNWAGIVLNGYVRDTKNTKEIEVGLFALGTCPQKTVPPKEGTLHVNLSFGGVTFREGEYLYADRDGIIVSATPLEM